MSDLNQPGRRDGIEGDEPPPDAEDTTEEVEDIEGKPVLPVVPPPD
jgi:hypothetical protein